MLTYFVLHIFLFFPNLSIASAKESSQPPNLNTTAIIEFWSYGILQAKFKQTELSQVMGDSNLQVWEPHEFQKVAYIGYKFQELLTKVYSTDWRQSEVIVFEALDTYQSVIPTSVILNGNVLLAHQRKNSSFFIENKLQNQKKVPLHPFYLVWDNIGKPQLLAEGASYWPYQIYKIEISDFEKKFPKMLPPEDSRAEVKQGFLAFQKNCMSCHKIHDNGGSKGPELAAGIDYVSVRGKQWLSQWINNPRVIFPQTGMPAFNPMQKNRESTIQNIISYLEVMRIRAP